MDAAKLDALERAATVALRCLTPGTFLEVVVHARQLERENALLAAMLAERGRGRPPALLADYADDPEKPDAAAYRAAARRMMSITNSYSG